MSVRRNRSLTIGIALCLAGVLLALGSNAAILLTWLARGWPALLVVAGLVSLGGFAVKRRPSSPVPGGLLLGFGVLLLAFTWRSGASPVHLYAQWWPALIGVLALSELLRYYTHRPELGARPPIATPGRFALAGAIALSGVAAGQLATISPNVFARFEMPEFMLKLRSELFGEEFVFEPLTASAGFVPGRTVAISNRFGEIRVAGSEGDRIEVALTRRVNAYDRASAEQAAAGIQLLMKENDQLIEIGPGGEWTTKGVTTDLTVRVPRSAAVRIVQAHGDLVITDLAGGVEPLSIEAAHSAIRLERVLRSVGLQSRHGSLEVLKGGGQLVARVPGTEVTIDEFAGDIELEGADGVEIEDVTSSRIHLRAVDHARVSIERAAAPTGRLDLQIAGRHTRMTLDEIGGDVKVENAYGSLVAKRIAGDLAVAAEHTSVSIDGVGAITLATSHDDVRVANPTGRIDIRNRYGAIDLRLPADRTYSIDPSVDHGEIRIDNDVASGGVDAVPVVLQTSYDNIVVRQSSSRSAGRGAS